MKRHLTPEETLELAALGAPQSAATLWLDEDISVFTLADLIALLPSEITVKYDEPDDYGDTEEQQQLKMEYSDEGQWRVGYEIYGNELYDAHSAPELIDALFSLVKSLVKENPTDK